MTDPILVTAHNAADLLSISVATIRNLAADGQLERRYIGKGTRNYRITYDSLRRYADGLPADPVAS